VLLAGLVGAALLDRFRPLAARFLLALTMACFIYAAHNALGVFTPLLSSKKLAQEIQARWEPGDLVVINGEYQGGSSLGFYMDQRPLLLNGRMTGLEFGSHFPDAPPIFLEDADIRELWSGPQRLFLFTYEDQIEDLQRILPAELIHPLVSYGRKAILTNRP
ncbi:MAG: glycosyltransferase family 39 protein, partial [Acidobacteria bacterium]|nr:glycosyltransferase family 39 protein [Acidobacteriota bacterium]